MHTPVTSAPNDFAIWTAKVTTPPVAPLIRTFCPGRMLPWRRPCKAVNPAQATQPACSNVTLAGLITNPRSRVHAYCARVGRPTPKTSSPTLNSVTFFQPLQPGRPGRYLALSSLVCAARTLGEGATAPASSPDQ